MVRIDDDGDGGTSGEDQPAAPRDAGEMVSIAQELLRETRLDCFQVKRRNRAADTPENPQGRLEGLCAIAVGDDEYIIECDAEPETFEESGYRLFATSDDAGDADELVGEFVTFEDAFAHACKHVVKDRLWAATH